MHMHCAMWMHLIVMVVTLRGTSSKYQGPSFVHEPPNKVLFYNNTGAIIPCVTNGTPRPEVSWTTSDNITAIPIPGLRETRPDGSLVFSPFRAEDYRQDVHSATYKCSVSNIVGSIVSREVHVRGVLYQNFEARVYDEFVIRGNIGVLHCNLPSHVRDYVKVTSWKRDDGLVILQQRNNDNDRYAVYPSGELHIRNVDYSDSHFMYKCQVRNSLTRQSKESSSGGRLIVTEPQSHVPPRLTHVARHISANQGETIFLPCVAQGHPAPLYRWSRRTSGQTLDISPSDERRHVINGTLILRRVTAQDGGFYVCVAKCEAGEVRSETQLTVRGSVLTKSLTKREERKCCVTDDPPIKVNVWPVTQQVSTGSTVTINCTVTGHPISTIEWVKNQQSLTLSRRVVLISRTVLHITTVEREDRGMYQCIARNDEDSAQGSAELAIASEPPVLLSKFEELIVKPGESVSLRCSAVGNPLPQITWYSYDLPVQDTSRIRVGDYVSREGSVISFINITRVEVSDGGQYECRAINEYGVDAFSSIVHVRGPPSIRPIRNRTAVAGDFLIIHCPISGYPIHSIRWMKGNRQLPLGRRQKVFTNGTLLIQGLDGIEDEGKYRCQVESDEGIKASVDVFLKVLVPPSITPFSFPKNPQEGMRASVSCSVPTGDAPIRISWLKDGIPLSLESGISLEMIDDFVSTLIFKSLRQEHSGTYTCVAYNDAATVNYSVPLSVSAPPRWRVEPNDQFVPVGGTVILDCTADGRPEPRVIWKKANDESGDYRTVISGSHIQTLVNGSLVIRDVEQEDDGRYMCEASNGIGTPLSTVVKLTVHVPAHFKQKFVAQTVRTGESVTLKCEAFGEKPMTYMWLKDKQPFGGLSHPRYMLREQMLNSGHLSELTIHVVERQDNGLYTCVASNAFGQDEKHNQLTVQERPDPPSNLEAIHTSGRKVVLRWSKPFNGNSAIVKYILEYVEGKEGWNGRVRELLTDGDQLQISVEDLQPVTQYNFRLVAENAVGRSLPSIPLNVITESEVPGAPPRNVHAVATDSKTIHVSWEPPLKNLHHGSIRGYYIGYKISGTNDPFVYKTVEVKEGQDRSCDITLLRQNTKYSVVVQAFNDKGAGPLSDEVTVRTLEFDPPKPPFLKIAETTTSSILLLWETANGKGTPVSGYVLHWREHGLEWAEVQIPSEKTNHKFSGLNCGTSYKFYITAFNSMGKGQPSDVITARTEGSAPIAPSEQSFITRNATTFILRLSAWKSGGCPILFFVIQYKQQRQLDWNVLSPRIEPEEEYAKITNLTPSTWYSILVTAHNNAGPTEVEYVTSTLTLQGGTIEPEIVGEKEQLRKYKSLSIIVPVSCAVIVLIAVSLAVFFLVCKKRGTRLTNHYEDTTKSHHLQSITEEGIPCDIDAFVIHEKLAMGNMWTPNHRYEGTKRFTS
ncbi:Down syndrome cell adhesion molecule-like [Argiope bruennichi]|uniref:Down syndrome cell adhesion molecule-like n=1 Tax=Argiope bruennichi TaxID=94029 RepID=A0A8T0G060_ARGBR|nr:Down syndrome cell adhesion molecule-like [Argiope bruennichi]